MEYKQARNKVVNDIRKAKSDHYSSPINQYNPVLLGLVIFQSHLFSDKVGPYAGFERC